MTTFGTMLPDGTLINVREIDQHHLMACPHCILVPEHYRGDGSCRCDDPTDRSMRIAGYHWNRKRKMWVE